MFKFIIVVLIIIMNLFSYVINAEVENNVECNDLLQNFSIAVSSFTYCSVIHSKPITLCENCAESFLRITETYTQLTKTYVNGTVCIDNFINLDRLQIVNSVYKDVNSLWNRANCHECIKFINDNYTFTKAKKDFDELYQNFSYCKLINYDKNSTFYCEKCMDVYVKLNKFYFGISGITSGINGICMDIVDQMNKTQANWSEVCCKYRVKNETTYIIVTVFMCLLPLLFYVFVKIFASIKRPKLLPQNRFAESINTPSASLRRDSM